MYFAKTLFVCASLVASAVSQSRIAFTVLPSSIQAGKDVTLHWGGGDGSPVTLTLQQGTTTNLKTVELVAGAATGTSYTWSVPKNLPDGTNYALRIQQGDTDPNYTGMITVTGGAPSGSTFGSSSAGSSSSVSATALSTASASSSTVSSSASKNSTASATSKPTVVGTAGKSAGTGASMARNTTMSSATLSATSTGASSTGSNSAVGGSGGAPTGSSSASAPGSTKTGGAIALVASNFALVVCAVAGIVFLG